MPLAICCLQSSVAKCGVYRWCCIFMDQAYPNSMGLEVKPENITQSKMIDPFSFQDSTGASGQISFALSDMRDWGRSIGRVTDLLCIFNNLIDIIFTSIAHSHYVYDYLRLWHATTVLEILPSLVCHKKNLLQSDRCVHSIYITPSGLALLMMVIKGCGPNVFETESRSSRILARHTIQFIRSYIPLTCLTRCQTLVQILRPLQIYIRTLKGGLKTVFVNNKLGVASPVILGNLGMPLNINL